MQRLQKRFLMSASFMLAALLLSVSVFAQEAPPQERRAPKPGDTFVFEREVVGPQGAGIKVQGGPGEDTAVFLLSEMSFDGRVVKGAPYSAQATTESTRTLSDGNRIKHKNSAAIYRDSDGRTRRDQELGAVGPWAMSGDPQQTVFINDPVAGINYVLDPRNHKKESLGKQVIEGVEAEGTRTTITIPAGEIGNEQRIQIVWERWYSPELQTVIMSRHSDPMVGETVYKLTNINRGEPARSLFEVPADYTVKEMPAPNARVFRKRSSDEK